MHLLRLAFIVLVLLAARPAHAQEIGLDFLRIGTNAAAEALGESGVALSRDAFSTYWNPAGLAAAPNTAAASHHLWVNGVRAYNVAARLQVGKNGGAGLFATAMSGGGNSVSEFDAATGPGIESAAAGVAYSYRFGPVAAGATLKYVSASYPGFNLSGGALDLGAQADFLNGTLRLGAALQNVGRVRHEDEIGQHLPRTWRAGIALFPLTIYSDDAAPLVRAYLTGEVSRELSTFDEPQPDNPEPTHAHLGIGTEWFELVTVRAGYVSGYAARDVSLGLGLGSGPFQVDYALIPFKAGAGTGHVLTLIYSWP
ncbi:MAG TPA: PorV/PorQ family protein [Rhodothermales bacterium]|nr:PorV/PorQ family protein [Rhodothermales bacterium]